MLYLESKSNILPSESRRRRTEGARRRRVLMVLSNKSGRRFRLILSNPKDAE